MWTGLRIHYPIIAGWRREKRGGGESAEKWGGGKIGRRGNEENSARAATKKRGGRDKGWEIQVYNAYHFKRNEKYSDPLNSPKLFLWFCFSWLYLTHLEFKKMFTYFFIFLNKRVHILYKVPISVWKCTIMYLYSEKYSGGGPPDSPFFTCIYCLRVCFKNALFKNEPWGIFCYYYSPPPNFE